MVLIPQDEPNDEEKLEQLPEDLDTPFRAAQPENELPTNPDEVRPDEGGLQNTHPATDTNMEEEEEYDEGISGAAEAGEPNAKNKVVGYDPAIDHRLHGGQS